MPPPSCHRRRPVAAAIVRARPSTTAGALDATCTEKNATGRYRHCSYYLRWIEHWERMCEGSSARTAVDAVTGIDVLSEQ